MNVRPAGKRQTEGTQYDLVSDYTRGSDTSPGNVFEGVAVDDLAPPQASLVGRVEAMAALFENVLQKERGIAALVARPDDAGLVVSENRHVVEMNGAAAAFVAGTNFLSIKTTFLSLNDLDADRWLGQALFTVMPGIDGEPVTRILRNRDDMVQLAVFAIPRSRYDTASVTLPPLFLLLFRDLTGPSENRSLKDLADSFGLTAAEIRLCEELVNNRSLQQAADLFQLSLGTVRQRLKVIFQKTGTHRQSELMSLLTRFL